MVADGQLVVPGGDGSVLLEPGNAALDDVAPPRAHWIDQGWSAAPGTSAGSGLLLVGALRDGVGDLPLAEQPPTGAVAVAPIGGQMGRALARPPQPAGARTRIASSSGSSWVLSWR